MDFSPQRILWLSASSFPTRHLHHGPLCICSLWLFPRPVLQEDRRSASPLLPVHILLFLFGGIFLCWPASEGGGGQASSVFYWNACSPCGRYPGGQSLTGWCKLRALMVQYPVTCAHQRKSKATAPPLLSHQRQPQTPTYSSPDRHFEGQLRRYSSPLEDYLFFLSFFFVCFSSAFILCLL